MKKISELVQYDFQRNTFYKINKQTGQSQQTYKNGQKVRNFRHNITGQNYLLRRNHQKNDVASENSKIFKQKSVNNNRQLQHSILHKLMNNTKREHKNNDDLSISMKQTSPFSNLQQVRKSIQKSRKGSILIDSIEIGSQLSKEKSEQNLKKLQFNKTLRSYDKLLNNLLKQPKSPRKDIPGYQQTKDPLQTLCTTVSSFRKKQYVLDLKTPRKCQTIEMGEKYSPRDIFLCQKKIYLKYNPEYKPKDDSSKVKILTQRKRNLKILQQLFIRENNKKTKSIYSFYQ